MTHHRLCVRANVLLGDLELASGNLEAAIETWKRIESQNPAYLSLVANRIYEAYKDRNRAEDGLNLLRGLLEKYPSLDALNVVFQATLELTGGTAYRIVRDELRRTPTLLGLDNDRSATDRRTINGGATSSSQETGEPATRIRQYK